MRPPRAASSSVFQRPLWSRVAAVTFAGSLLPASAGIAFAQESAPSVAPDDAKAHLAAGDKAAKAKDWATAAKEYDAAAKAQMSQAALLGYANATYQLQRYGEAYDAYDTALKTYGKEMRGADRYAAQKRVKELAPKTGALALRIPETGAEVRIDERVVGRTPLPAQIRVTPGSHKITVTKDGFAPVERTVDVPAGGKSVEDIALTALAPTGRLAVTEKTGKTLRVLVDGVDVGATPFEGDVEPGSRQVEGKSAGAIAPPQTVEVTRGKASKVELVATDVFAHLEVRTSDNKGTIYLDGKLVAEGSYVADVPIGTHVLEVKREGFVKYEKTLELADKQTRVESVTLLRQGGTVAAVKPSEARTLDGIYGGVRIGASFVSSGYKSSIETNCAGLGATSCSTPTPLGGSLAGYVGYAYYPFALELFFGGGADVVQQHAIYDGQTGSEVNPLVAKPARDEKFTIARGGGFGALRARFSYDVSFLRLSAAVGVGVAGRYGHLARETTTTDPPGLQNVYNGSGKVYVSPGVSGDLSVQLKASRTLAIALGFDLWADDAGDQVRTEGSSNQILVGPGQAPAPIATPPYDILKGSQVTIGPYLGVQFGP